jgi:hypothetical protein
MSAASNTPPPEVLAEFEEYLGAYEKSLREGLADYFGDADDDEDGEDAEWKESEHARGQPGNKGQFGPGGGSGGKSEKAEPKESEQPATPEQRAARTPEERAAVAARRKEYRAARRQKAQPAGGGAARPAPPPVELASPVSGDYKNYLAAAVAKFPDKVRQALKDDGVKIRVGASLTDIRPDLKGVQPRGWPPGMTWDNVDGLHDPNDRSICCSEFRTLNNNAKVPSRRAAIYHETGHAFDDAMGSTDKTECKDAYNADTAKLTAYGRERLTYFLQKGSAGRRECFAEVFACEIGEATDKFIGDIRQYFPNMTKFVRQEVSP